MKIRSILNKLLLLIPAALVAPLLTLATPAPSCTSGAGTLTPTNSVSFTDTTSASSMPPADATFTCTGVTFTPSFFIGSSDFVSTTLTGFSISSDVTSLPIADTNVVFTGIDSSTLQPIQFLVTDGPISGKETVSMTPEPGSMLLFGTGLLIAGGLIRRRLLIKTVAD
jgi:hypothetical protein